MVHVNPQALIWFWETTMTVLSYCLKNGRLVPVLYPERGLGVRLDWYQSHYLWSMQMMSSWYQVMSKSCRWKIWHDLWIPGNWILVQILSPFLSTESRVQVLYCPERWNSLLPLPAHCKWYLSGTYEHTYASSTMSWHSGARDKTCSSNVMAVISLPWNLQCLRQ